MASDDLRVRVVGAAREVPICGASEGCAGAVPAPRVDQVDAPSGAPLTGPSELRLRLDAPPSSLPLRLSGSVGLGGANRREDVLAVQRVLLNHGLLRPEHVTGTIASEPSDATVRALTLFQTYYVAGRSFRPDGIVHAGRPTEHALNGMTGRLVLGGSVGRKGENRASDVVRVQRFLQSRGLLAAGSVPGVIDDATIAAITAYQKDVVGMQYPDGRIDLGNRTWRTIDRELCDGRTPRPPVRTPATRTPPAPPRPLHDPSAGAAALPRPSAKHAPNAGEPSDPGHSTPLRSKPIAPEDDVASKVDRKIEGTPAQDMTEAEAYAELQRLGIPARKVSGYPGIADAVRIEFPLLGVEFPYVLSAPRGVPKLIARKSAVLDVRFVAGLAHTIQHIQAVGAANGQRLVQINQIGGYVPRNGDGTPKTGGHAHAQAMDLHSFVLEDASGRRQLISLSRDWLTARSSRGPHNHHVVVQTDDEKAKMGPNERWLRQLWGFLHSEFDFVVTPSHNKGHLNHFHPEITPTRPQRRRQAASLAADDD